MNEVIPGILEHDWSEIDRKFEILIPFAKTVHVDIIDGIFADNTTFLDPEPFRKFADNFLLELHMMVNNPIALIESWAGAGFKRFIGHIEKMPHQEHFLDEARKFGEAGIAIDGPTDISEILAPLDKIDTILVMDITAGFSGQTFNEMYMRKIQELRDRGFRGSIEVDGGINGKTITIAKNSGANRFVTTSHLFSSENIEEEYKRLLELVS